MTTRKKTTSQTAARGAPAMHGHAGAKQGPGQRKTSPARTAATTAKSTSTKRQADDDIDESTRTSAPERDNEHQEAVSHGARDADRDNDERTRRTLKSNLERDPVSRHREAVTGTEAEEDGVNEEALDEASESDVERAVDEDEYTDERPDGKRQS